jgi:dCMP deaminase
MIKEKYLGTYLKTARLFAEHSSAVRKKVGAVIVKDDRIISIGYNGMPTGWDNNCEDKDYMSGDAGGWLDIDEIDERWPYQEQQLPKESNLWRRYNLKTKPEVLHAESNAIAKLAKSSESGNGASMFITCAPCIDCAKMIFQSGIREVFYGEDYRDDNGIRFLNKCGITVKQII